MEPSGPRHRTQWGAARPDATPWRPMGHASPGQLLHHMRPHGPPLNQYVSPAAKTIFAWLPLRLGVGIPGKLCHVGLLVAQRSVHSASQRACHSGPSPQSSSGSRQLASPPIWPWSVCAIDVHARRASACRGSSRAASVEEQFAVVAVLDEPPAEEQRGPEEPETSKWPSNSDVMTCKAPAASMLGTLMM